jgi:hypothetical protein
MLEERGYVHQGDGLYAHPELNRIQSRKLSAEELAEAKRKSQAKKDRENQGFFRGKPETKKPTETAPTQQELENIAFIKQKVKEAGGSKRPKRNYKPSARELKDEADEIRRRNKPAREGTTGEGGFVAATDIETTTKPRYKYIEDPQTGKRKRVYLRGTQEVETRADEGRPEFPNITPPSTVRKKKKNKK